MPGPNDPLPYPPPMPAPGTSDRFMLPDSLRRGYGRFQIQGPLPAPVSMVAQGPKKQPSLWERMQEMVAPRPEGLEGLVGTKDVKDARTQGLLQAGLAMLEGSGWSTEPRTFGQIAGRAANQGIQAYQGNIDRVAQQAAAKQGVDLNRMKMEAFKTEQAKVAQLDAARKQIITDLGRPDSSDPDGVAKWIDAALPRFIEAGDETTAQQLTAIRSTLGPSGQKRLYEVDRGDVIELRDPRTNQVVETLPKGINPRDTSANAAAAQDMRNQRMFSRANMLGDDYRSVTSNIQKAADQYRTMVSSAAEARKGIPAAQIALVFSFMKTLDPTSVVRESEYATAENARGVPESVRNAWNKLKDGTRLTPGQVEEFLGVGKSQAKEWKRQMDLHKRTYDDRAGRWGLNPQDVTMDFFEGMDFSDPVARQPGPWKSGYVMPAAPQKEQMFPPKGR